MQEERFEVFFQNISGLYRAVQRLRAQFAQMSGVSSVHLFWLYLLREYPEGLAASRLAELSNIDRRSSRGSSSRFWRADWYRPGSRPESGATAGKSA